MGGNRNTHLNFCQIRIYTSDLLVEGDGAEEGVDTLDAGKKLVGVVEGEAEGVLLTVVNSEASLEEQRLELSSGRGCVLIHWDEGLNILINFKMIIFSRIFFPSTL